MRYSLPLTHIAHKSVFISTTNAAGIITLTTPVPIKLFSGLLIRVGS